MLKKEDIFPELLNYASNMVKNNFSARDVRKWLQERNFDITDFFMALTLIKTNKLDAQSYAEVSKEFMENFKNEIIENHSRSRFYYHENSLLYRAALNHVGQESSIEMTENPPILT